MKTLENSRFEEKKSVICYVFLIFTIYLILMYLFYFVPHGSLSHTTPKSRAREYLSRQAYANPKLFVHWQQGVMPKRLDSWSRMS